MNRQELIDAKLFHSIHTSERKAFRACRRRWLWSYRMDYHPTVMPKPLEFGIAWHIAMETWYNPDKWAGDRRKVYLETISIFGKTLDDQLKRFEELNGTPDDATLLDYAERRALGFKMIDYYCLRISTMLDKHLTPLAVEIPFEVDMEFNCHCRQCQLLWARSEIGISHHDKWQESLSVEDRELGIDENYYWDNIWEGLPVTFGGRIDAIFKDSLGRILVFDWKTTARMLDGEDEAAFLELDDQVGGYPVAVHKLGRQVDGFIYHEQKKAVPEPPKRLNRAYKGKIYSCDKTANVEYTTFLSTIMKEDLYAYNNGLYDDYLEFLLSPMAPRFYQRHTIFKTEKQMDNFWGDLKAEAKDMLEVPRIYPQASRFSCNSCLYRQPCEAKNRSEDYMFLLETMFTKDRG